MSKARDIADLLDSAGKVTADDLDVGAIGGRRNLIINGAMQVWQRGTSFTNYSGAFTADRWVTGNPSTMSVTRVSTPYGYGLSYTRPTAWGAWQRIEWQNVSWLKAGDVLTLQYICNKNAAGNTALQDGAGNGVTYASTGTTTDEGNGYFKMVETYVVTQALIDACSSVGFLHLGIEPCTLTGEFTLTNVQLELGSVATPFEHRSYGEELALCQRYYQQYDYHDTYRHIASGIAINGSQLRFVFPFIHQMRISPSFSHNGIGNFRVNTFSVGKDETSVNHTLNHSSPFGVVLTFGKTTSNMDTNENAYLNTEGGNDASLRFDAEL